MTSPKSTIKWGPSVQMPEMMGDTFIQTISDPTTDLCTLHPWLGTLASFTHMRRGALQICTCTD